MPRPHFDKLLARLRSEDGIGVVEVLVASVVLVLGALATMGLVDAAHHQSYRAEQDQVVQDRLQAEMEAIKRLEYVRIALTGAPTFSADADNPDHRVGDQSGTPTFALNRNGTNSAALVISGQDGVTGGVVEPGPDPFTSGDLGAGGQGDVTGTIHRYVTWMDDPNCPETACPGGKDFKRLIVAIKLDDTASGGDRTYYELQSDVVDGSLAQVEGATPSPPAPSAAIPYSLSDTPCAPAGQSNPRVAPSSHDAHNTLGSCAAGVQTGSEIPGAPDRLYHAQRSPVPSSQTGSFDFSVDVVTQQPSDEGLQIPIQPKECDYAPIRSNAHLQVHRWLTAPVTAGDFVLDGTASLTLYSKTINGVPHTGKLCIWLFVREPTNTGGEADTLIPDPQTGRSYFTYSTAPENWRSESWDPAYQIPLSFADLRLEPGDRLGLALAVDSTETPGEALQVRYDHPSHDSILQVYSTTKANAPD